jgi:hypothetical protein
MGYERINNNFTTKYNVESKQIRIWVMRCSLRAKRFLLCKLLRAVVASQKEKKICQGAWLLKTKQRFNYVTVGGVCDGSSTLLLVAYDKNACD